MKKKLRIDDVDLLTIQEFCDRHRISRQFYYQLQKQGIGPQETRIGSRVLISKTEAQRWREECEEVTRGAQYLAERAKPK